MDIPVLSNELILCRTFESLITQKYIRTLDVVLQVVSLVLSFCSIVLFAHWVKAFVYFMMYDINPLRPEQNCRNFKKDIFRCVLLNVNHCFFYLHFTEVYSQWFNIKQYITASLNDLSFVIHLYIHILIAHCYHCITYKPHLHICIFNVLSKFIIKKYRISHNYQRKIIALH